MQYNAAQIADHLRKEIILGKYERGDSLGEVTLARRYEVSRGPIRDALAMLTAERMAEKRTNGRTVAIGYDIKGIKDLYDARILLETHAISRMDGSLFEKYGSGLHDYIRMMKNANDYEERDIETDLSFHYLLVKMSGNETLMHLWNTQRNVFRTLVDITSEVTFSSQDEIIAQHTRLVEALEDGDLVQASELLRKHLEEACEHCCRGKRLI
ncbi:GntR family transcriptional regulator [Lacicoccus alkaliphilus]|uniref:DNA-binding transcriptional regulator, GntR family n=1 Tax=Lacicoccus alkaliphilus DSM 16010 TaxID=1123231 RepID=A0A1M7KP31_9BACL|nr:GntR family transcriptional regulator [Salinicoccus alkaliphilus]SHM67156.1 DNA-binding transcriptional regulator, GntR family [Salinicoccus alkaliphilus DSM 16010]